MTQSPTIDRLSSLVRQLQGMVAADEVTLAALVAALDGKTVRSGSGTLTWPGGTGFSNTLTLAHGLPGTPASAKGTATLAGGTFVCLVSIVAVDATDIQWRGYAADGSTPAAAATKLFYWDASV